MTKTEPEVEQHAVDPVDPIPDQLYTWGLAGDPLRMATSDIQPVVAAIRMANVGDGMTASDVQPILDESFPDGDYVASDLVLAHPPVGTFTVVDGDADTPTVFTADDHDLDLPDEHIRWDFGDGTQAEGTKVDHQYGASDDYTVTCRVSVAGRLWESQQDYRHLGGPPPVVAALNPRQAVVGSTRKFTLRVAGTNFDDSTKILFDGEEVATTVVNDLEVTTLVDPRIVTDPKSVLVSVNQGGRLSNSRGFDFIPGATTPAGVEGLAVEGRAADEEEEEFDPSDHTVDDVLVYAEANPDEVPRLIGSEESGKARVTLLEKLHAMNDDE